MRARQLLFLLTLFLALSLCVTITRAQDDGDLGGDMSVDDAGADGGDISADISVDDGSNLDEGGDLAAEGDAGADLNADALSADADINTDDSTPSNSKIDKKIKELEKNSKEIKEDIQLTNMQLSELLRCPAQRAEMQAKLTQQLETLSIELASAKIDAARMKSVVPAAQSQQSSDVSQERDSLKEQVRNLGQRLQDISAELEKYKVRADSTREANKALEQKVIELTSELTRAQGDKQRSDHRADRMEQAAIALRGQVAAIAADRDKYNKQLLSLVESKNPGAEATKLFTSCNNERTQLTNQVQHLMAEKSKLQADLHQSHSENKACQVDKKNMKSKNDVLTMELQAIKKIASEQSLDNQVDRNRLTQVQ